MTRRPLAGFGILLALFALQAVHVGFAHAEAPAPSPAPSPPIAGVAQQAPAQGPAAAPTQAAPEDPPASPAPLPAPALPASAEQVTPPPANKTRAAVPGQELAPPSEIARLDYSDGVFYLRSVDDNMVFVPSGRMHIDTYTYAGKGVQDYHRGNNTGLTTQIFFRRFVLESGGIIHKKWFWWMGGNFGPDTLLDDSQAVISNAHVYDGFVGYLPAPNIRLYFGQFNAPVTMENVTSSRWLDFMERALTVRTLATPSNKAVGPMIWANTPDNMFEGQLGALSAEGVINRMSVDGHFHLMARFVVRPLAKRSDALSRTHVGVSGRYRKVNPDFLNYDTPNLSTPGNYPFWSSSYGTGAQRTVVIPDLKQAALDGEAYLPFERWDLRGEFTWIYEQRREALAADRNTSLRGGLFDGYGLYAQASFWPLGTPRINGNPAGFYGTLAPPKKYAPQAAYGLQLLLRAEVLRLDYDSNSRFGSQGGLDATTTNIAVNAYQACVNLWATKHIRLTAEYSLYHFPGTPKTDNQALAPGARAGTSPSAHLLDELSFRVGLAL